jgi:predicted DCC family thiol-disulfide oxidoreductase YuxK
MHLANPARSEWIAYDASCGLCLGSVHCFRRLLARHGFMLVPLQTRWVKQRLGLEGEAVPEEMKALLADGTIKGGVDCLLAVCDRVWWLKPVERIGRLPSARAVLDRSYGCIARNRHCLVPRPPPGSREHHHRSASFFEML